MLKAILALLIVYFILRKTELYTSFLDGDWVPIINDPQRKGEAFNKCSPESFADCEKPEMRYLSRY